MLNTSMRILIFVLFLNLNNSNLFGFNSDSLKRVSIGLFVSPNYSNRLLSVDTSYGFWIYDYQSVRQYREKPKLGFSLGVNTIIRITNNLNIITGLSFFEKGYKDNDNNLHKPPCIYMLGKVDINYHLNYLSIPLKIEYKKDFSNLSVFINTGVGFDYLVKNTFTIINSKGSIALGENTIKEVYLRNGQQSCSYAINYDVLSSKLTMSGLLDFGLGFNPTEKLNLRISSVLSYSFNSVFEYPVKENLYSIGLKFSAYYDLNN